jgi:hypothetical protein
VRDAEESPTVVTEKGPSGHSQMVTDCSGNLLLVIHIQSRLRAALRTSVADGYSFRACRN